MDGASPVYKNLRIDNKCQSPKVTMPTGTRANMEDYHAYTATGAIAYLLPAIDDYEYTFTLVEVYGGAHLAFAGLETSVTTVSVVGDDTGYIHLAPRQTLKYTE
ncbi:hypothetical protein LSAT2_021877, partial [Lamellibrachia satsuma]